jgi:hypothetical protein
MAQTPTKKTPANKAPASKKAAPQEPVAKTIQLTLTVDEAEMLVDALEADHEGYIDVIKEARGNNNRDEVKTFSDAATRIQELMAKIQELIGDDED